MKDKIIRFIATLIVILGAFAGVFLVSATWYIAKFIVMEWWFK